MNSVCAHGDDSSASPISSTSACRLHGFAAHFQMVCWDPRCCKRLRARPEEEGFGEDLTDSKMRKLQCHCLQSATKAEIPQLIISPKLKKSLKPGALSCRNPPKPSPSRDKELQLFCSIFRQDLGSLRLRPLHWSCFNPVEAQCRHLWRFGSGRVALQVGQMIARRFCSSCIVIHRNSSDVFSLVDP